MLKAIILSTMFATFLNLAKAQNRKLVEISGLIIFESKDSIPQEVIFIPINDMRTNNIKELIAKGLDENNFKVPILYFQSLRWIIPNLLDILNNSNGYQGLMQGKIWINKKTPVKIILSTLLFDITTNPEELLHPLVDEVNLTLLNENFNFKIYDAPASLGYLNFFKVK